MVFFQKLDNVARYISRKLVSCGQIEEEDIDLYVYGFREGIILMINLVMALLIGMAFGQFEENVIFLLSYCILRKYAGGYHASSREGCFVRSMLLVVVIMIIIKCFKVSLIPGMLIMIFSSVIIGIVSPVENVKKPTNTEEKKYYRKYSRGVVLAELGIAIMLCLLHCNSLAQSVMLAVCSNCVLQLAVVVPKICRKDGALNTMNRI